jgi:hypothetical protein
VNKKPNPRLAKIHRNYTVEEIADLYGVHKNTVRSWIKAGLPVIDDSRPQLLLGIHLRKFLEQKRTKNKKKCHLDEFYCLSCRDTRKPAARMADFGLVTNKVGNLTALCPDCTSIMNKRISLAKIQEIGSKIDIRFPQGLEHIGDTDKPSLNCDF